MLANEVCSMCHGEDAAKEASETAERVFNQSNARKTAPVIVFEENKTLSSILVEVEFVKSGKDAKRLITEGVVQVNDEVINDPQHKVTFNKSEIIKVSAGKKRQANVRFDG